MFGLFKKDNNIYSPIDGYCSDITECKDPVFAGKMLGDGFIVKPINDLVKSPCNGKIIMVFPTKHAIGIKMDNGQEVMIHIGTNTVKLKGEGFKTLVSQNMSVKKGTPLLQLDLDYIQSQGYDATNIVVLTNTINKQYIKGKINCNVITSDKIIEFGRD